MHYLMYIPAHYVPSCLHSQALMPHQFWEAIMPQIQADNKIVECKTLVTWMRELVTLKKVRMHTTPP